MDLLLENLPDPVDRIANLALQAEASFRAARCESTIRAYLHDWKDFHCWCEQNGFVSLPASSEVTILYATDLTKNCGKKWNTLLRRLAAISQMHHRNQFDTPTGTWPVRQFLTGLRRELGVAPVRKKPILVADLRRILEQLPQSTLGIRDRALLLLGFAGALRRSELVALDVDSLEHTREGLILSIQRSKTDQDAAGRKIGIPRGTDPITCPVTAVQDWLTAGRIKAGALFRVMNRHGHVINKRLSGAAVALVVKRYVEKLGYEPTHFSGHSLRAGLATSAAAAGKAERAIMSQTGHRSVVTVRRYIRDGNLFRDNAADGLGL